MKCLHCQVEIHPYQSDTWLNAGNQIGTEKDTATHWRVYHMSCPACGKALINLQKIIHNRAVSAWAIYPHNATRPPAPREVPEAIGEDFNEAAAVLPHSPKASAALSRRCLQGVLRDQGYAQHDLAPAIQAAIDSKTIPAALADNLDAVRNIGNFAAHPMKDKQTDIVLPVEPHEAEWNLEVLEGLFDLFYVQPAKAAERRQALNAKLSGAGKPPLKKT